MEPKRDWELTDSEIRKVSHMRYEQDWSLDKVHRAIATAAGQKARKDLADRTQQLLNDWAYLDDAEFAQKSGIKKTFLPHLYAEWLKGQGL